jgi:hypothetical protein
MGLIDHYPIYQTKIGPRYSLYTLTIGNTYVSLIYSRPNFNANHLKVIMSTVHHLYNSSLLNFVP